MGKLTAAKLKSLIEPGRYGDGDGLYLRIAPGGSRQWIQRIYVDGKRRDIGLGGYPAVSLAQARGLNVANRQQVAQGGNPLAERERAAVPTFRQATERLLDLKSATWKSAKHRSNWQQSLERHAFPTIGEIPVDRIDRLDTLAVLTPIWTATPETARRVRQRMGAVFSWAMAHGYRPDNPAGETIGGALPAMPKTRSHFRNLPYSEVPAA
jgi:hypothetical protein